MSACAGWKGGSPVSLRRLQISSGSTDRSLMLRPRASWRWQGWEFQTGKNSVRDALCGTPNPDQRLVDISFALLPTPFPARYPDTALYIHPVRRFEFPAPTLFGYTQNDVGAFGPETLDIALELAILIIHSGTKVQIFISPPRLAYALRPPQNDLQFNHL